MEISPLLFWGILIPFIVILGSVCFIKIRKDDSKYRIRIEKQLLENDKDYCEALDMLNKDFPGINL
jgi:hypothetical protein